MVRLTGSLFVQIWLRVICTQKMLSKIIAQAICKNVQICHLNLLSAHAYSVWIERFEAAQCLAFEL